MKNSDAEFVSQDENSMFVLQSDYQQARKLWHLVIYFYFWQTEVVFDEKDKNMHMRRLKKD